MKLLIYFLFILDFLSCSNDKDKGSYFLDKDYDFILGFAVPDEDRLAPTEVFVGRMIDKVPESITFRSGALDSFLLHQVQRYQGWYHFTLKFHDDAEVSISSEGQKIKLEYRGNGIYRDVNNELHIEPLGTYLLEVKRPGNRLYTQFVTVPGNFDFINIHAEDTVGPIFPKQASDGFCYALYPIICSWSQGAYLYRAKTSTDVESPFKDKANYYSGFEPDKDAIFISYKSDVLSDTIRSAFWETIAFDSSASRFYQAESPMGLDDDVDDFYTYWNQGPIARRNGMNTHGADDVVGNFSAYNAIRTHFWITARKDSCGL